MKEMNPYRHNKVSRLCLHKRGNHNVKNTAPGKTHP
jgi:hypothetical protein